jgi:hypothetical protein
MPLLPPHLADRIRSKECPGGKKHVGKGIPASSCYQCHMDALQQWEEELKKREEEKKR